MGSKHLEKKQDDDIYLILALGGEGRRVPGVPRSMRLVSKVKVMSSRERLKH